MFLSLFKKCSSIVCLALILVILIALAACGNNQEPNAPAVADSTEAAAGADTGADTGAAAEAAQQTLTVQEAREMLNDVFSDSGTITYRAAQDRTEGDVRFYAFEVNTSDDSRVYAMAWVNSITGAVDIEPAEAAEEPEYSAEHLEIRNAVLGQWHVYDADSSQRFAGGEVMEFFPDGTGNEQAGGIFPFEWRVVHNHDDVFRLILDFDGFELDYWLQAEGGELMLFYDAGPPIILSREPWRGGAVQPADANGDYQDFSGSPLVGRWSLRWPTADYYFPVNDLTLELFASHWGEVVIDEVESVSEFMWVIHYDGEYPSIELQGYWAGEHVQLEIITGFDGGNLLELRNWRTHHVYVFDRI